MTLTTQHLPDPSPQGRVAIAGGSGFIGLNLARYLANHGCDVIVISRNPPSTGPWRHAAWDGRTVGDWAVSLDGADALVNVAGRTVDCVKTADHRDEILRSRVESTRALGRALRTVSKPPPVWVQMSTAHIHGDPEVLCDEDAVFGYGLAPFVAEAWEKMYAESVLPGMRQVILRTSFVMGRHSGAFPRMAKVARWGLGGRMGSGRQGMSWIHELDMSRLIARAIADENMNGAYMATAPYPVSNAEFMRELRRALGVRIGLPTPAWLAKFGATHIMRTDYELALYGRFCVSNRLEREGFTFRFPHLRAALTDLCTHHP